VTGLSLHNKGGDSLKAGSHGLALEELLLAEEALALADPQLLKVGGRRRRRRRCCCCCCLQLLQHNGVVAAVADRALAASVDVGGKVDMAGAGAGWQGEPCWRCLHLVRTYPRPALQGIDNYPLLLLDIVW
jgi:hypothetical protein